MMPCARPLCEHLEAHASESWNGAMKNIYIGVELFALLTAQWQTWHFLSNYRIQESFTGRGMFIDMGSTASGWGVLESWEQSFLTHLVLLPGNKQRLSQGSAINPRPGKYPQVRMSTASIVDVIKYSDQKQLMGGNGLLLLTASSHSLLLRKVEGRPGCYHSISQRSRAGPVLDTACWPVGRCKLSYLFE